MRRRSYLIGGLTIKKGSNLERWLHLAIASIVYILANIVDYYFTVYGMINTTYREGNSIIRAYMTLFGPANGLLIYKALMVGMIILSVIGIDLVYRKKGIKFKRFRPEYILYVGAFLTVLGGALWFALP